MAGKTRGGREVPRPFEFHWGGGQIVEEASYVGKHTEPAIQLLEYEGQKGGSLPPPLDRSVQTDHGRSPRS